MNSNEAMVRARQIAKAAKLKTSEDNFLEFSEDVASAAKSLTQEQRDKLPWFRTWVRAWKKLHDEFDG